MPRKLTRQILREIRQDQLIPLELLDVSTQSPFTAWDFHFVNNIEPINFAGGIYTPLGFSRGNFESESGGAVDRVTMQLDDVAKFWAVAVQRTIIQGCRIRLRKIFMGHLDNEEDSIVIFDGYTGSPRFDDSTFSVEIRSILAYQETELPTRTFQSNCPYHLGESRCGIDMSQPENTIHNVIAWVSSTAGRIRSPQLAGFQPRYFDAGYVYCTGGVNKGVTRPISNSGPVSGSALGEVQLFIPFEYPTEGCTFRVVRGCRKTKVDCASRFQNFNAAGQLRYGGFSEVPRTPAVEIAAT